LDRDQRSLRPSASYSRPSDRDEQAEAAWRRARFAPRDTWTRARIIAALRDWAELVGQAPRSYEWGPSSARSRGKANANCELWETLHPRWPSYDTVRAHCRSWNEALSAAGLTRNRDVVRGEGLAERVARAKRLAQAGAGPSIIARLLGVGASTAAGYIAAHSCLDCSGPVVTSAPRCRRCAAKRANRPAATKDEIVASLRAWERQTGQVPLASDWAPARGEVSKWMTEYPRWPTRWNVTRQFGNWHTAVAMAGLHAPRRHWDEQAILEALRAFRRDQGRWPARGDLSWQLARLPSHNTVRRHWGTLARAIEAARSGRYVLPSTAELVSAPDDGPARRASGARRGSRGPDAIADGPLLRRRQRDS
jgi:hypothetical protein